MKTYILLFLSICCLGLATANAQTINKDSPPPAAESADNINPLLVGETTPAQSVKEINGNPISLHEIISRQPTVLVFYRGGWCPYCNSQLAELQGIVKDIRQLGYQIVGVSADKPSRLKQSLEEHDLDYTLYSDNTMKAARAFGIAYTVDPETIRQYKENGMDLAQASGYDHGILPVPSVFLVDTEGNIKFQYVNPNYQVRLKPEVLLEAAKAYYPEEQ